VCQRDLVTLTLTLVPKIENRSKMKEKKGKIKIKSTFSNSDIRGLNHISKKDRYPLLLISNLLDSPCKARVYSKINLHYAYHLVRIADGDE